LLTAWHGKLLRPDALLCLLTLYDQMIFRPYAGSIIDPFEPNQDLALPTVARNPEEFAGAIQKSIGVIYEQLLEVEERPISAHQVLRVIDRVWPKLSALFGWG
jgi:hypothetical protein